MKAFSIVKRALHLKVYSKKHFPHVVTDAELNSICFIIEKNLLKGFRNKAIKIACKVAMKNIKPIKSILKKI